MISRNLSLRIMTGLPLAAATIWYIFGAEEIIFRSITVFIGLIAYYEYGNALKAKDIPIRLPLLYLSQILCFSSFWFFLTDQRETALLSLVTLLALIVIFSISNIARSHKLFFWYLFPIFWIVLPLIIVYLLRFRVIEARGSQLIFFLIWIAAFNDITAYFGGKRFGKRPLAPVISPKKTIEGSAFGILGGLVLGLLLIFVWMNDLFPVWKAVLIIIPAVIAAQLGDLVESKFKRYCGIKDSSGLIPGHGGLLDRIDAFLLSLPLYFGLLHVFGIV